MKKNQFIKTWSGNFSASKQALLNEELDGKPLQSMETSNKDRRSKQSLEYLSFGQQRLWYLDQLEPDLSLFNYPVAFKLKGRLDISVMRRALNEIIRRHEILRTTFVSQEDLPMQVIAPSLEIELPVVEFSNLTINENEDQLSQILETEAQRPFDLAKGPLVRAMLIRLVKDEYVLFFMTHHSVFDDWSFRVFQRELIALYEAFVSGNSSPLAELSIQYADFAVRQRKWQQGKEFEQQLSYWREQLKGQLPILQMPTDYPRPAMQSYCGSREILYIPEPLMESLEALGRSHGANLFMVVLAAFIALLYRYTGQKDLIVGSPIAGRERPETHELIGFFMNTLVLRTNTHDAMSFKELLSCVREVCLDAYRHQKIPFERLVEELQLEQDLSRTPLYQVLFRFQDEWIDCYTKVAGISWQPVDIHSKVAQTDLSLSLVKRREGFKASLVYSTDLFDTNTIVRMLKHFQVLLKGIVADPEFIIAELPLLTEPERQQVLVEFNDTKTDYPLDTCIHKLFETQADRTPYKSAIKFEEVEFTYCELNQRANQLAHYLRFLGIGPETFVGVCVKRSADMVVGLLAILKAGGAYVPLDPSYPPERLRFMLKDSGVSILLTHREHIDKLPEVDTNIIYLDDREIFSGYSMENPRSSVTPENPAYLIYTSGTTGQPKGVIGLHLGAVNRFRWMWQTYPFRVGEICCQKTSLGFIDSVWEIFGPLLQGVSTVIFSDSVLEDSQQFLDSLATNNVSRIVLVPSLLRILLDSCDDLQQRLPRLKHWTTSGEALPADLALQFKQKVPDCILLNLYGSSEVSADVTFCEVSQLRSFDLGIPIGRPIANIQAYIVNSYMQPQPFGVPGELLIGGAGLARGYLNRPELTSEKFIPDIFGDDTNALLFKTGDSVKRRPDGNLVFLGRIDQQVKIRGIRIELEEIESIMRRYSCITGCAVVVSTAQRERRKLVAKERKAREYTQQGMQQMLVAFYTAETKISRTELHNFLKINLPTYMIPQKFIQLNELPLNPNGKLDRKALSELDHLHLQAKKAYVAPKKPMEALIANIWQDVLGINKVGVNDSFFKMGGDSLLAMQVLTRIRRATSFKLSFRDLFENQTIAGLAELIQVQQNEKPVRPFVTKAVPQRKNYPLTMAQQGIWYLWQLEPDNPYYTDQGTIHIRGNISLSVLQRAWQALLKRHVILRVRFSMEHGNPVQIFEEKSVVGLPLIDLTHLPRTEQWNAIEREAKEKSKFALNLEKDPLMQAQLFKLSENEYQVLLTFHEITLDLWGVSIIVHDLAKFYRGFSKGEEYPLPDLEVQFGDYAIWENKMIRRHKLRAQEAYWKKELSGELPILNLPTDRPRPVSLNYRGAAKSVILDSDLSNQLKTLGFQENATLFMTLLAAFNLLLHVYSNQNDLIIGTPIAYRTNENAENLAGFFLNMLPLRTHFDSVHSFMDLLKQVKGKVTGAITNAVYPFMWMLEGINVVRDMSITPVFQVMFNMLNLPHVSLDFGELEFAYNQLKTGYIKYDLALYAQEHGTQIYLQLAYLTDLFNEDTIDRMLNNMMVILKSIVENPRFPISSLNVLNESEKQALIYDFNNTDRDFNNNLCIHQLFERQAQKTPGQIAFIFEGQHLTYEELNKRSNKLAHYLRQQGVGRETTVAICIERSFEMIVGLLAIMKAGGIYVALEPDYPLQRLYDILQDTKAAAMLIQKRLDRFDEFTGKKIYIDIDWKVIEEEEATNLSCLTTPDNLLNVVYTSSSTGKPKGTLITINNVLNRLFWMWEDYPFRPEDVALLQKSYALVAATWELFGALLKGIPTVILTQQDLLNPEEIWKKVACHNVSHLLATPAFHEGILIQGELHPGQCRSLRLATTSAEPITPAMVARWKKVFPEVPLLNLYGSTECASNVTVYDTSQMPSDAIRTPVGKPLANVRVYILDDNLNPVPAGATGEMCVTGACVARGYLNLPELTTKQFVPNPFSDKQGSILYKTGDLARYRSDGNIELVGRKDHQVKIRGFRVELGDIEEALLRHEMIEKCAVILYEDEVDLKRLVAYIVSNQKMLLTVNEIQHFLRERLPAYMVPATFIMLDSLPLTPNGKVDRHALPAPDRNRPELKDNYLAPQTETEKTIAAVWQNKLCLEKVGINDNFFDLGGHSLLLVQVHNHLQEILGRNFSMVKMFEHPTINSLAKCLSQETNNLSSFQQGDDQTEKLKAGKSRIKKLLKQRQKKAQNRSLYND